MIKMIEGVCKGCGQAQLVKVNVYEGDTEEDQKERASKTATAKCTCEESRRIAAWDKAVGTINRICDIGAEGAGFVRTTTEAKLAVIGAARQVFELNIDRAVLEVADSTITIKQKGDGLTITRKGTLEIGD